jgi:hypothetical protein
MDDELRALGQQRGDLIERRPEGLTLGTLNIAFSLALLTTLRACADVRWMRVPRKPESSAMSCCQASMSDTGSLLVRSLHSVEAVGRWPVRKP